MRRLAGRFDRPDWYLTRPELLAFWLVNLVALALFFAVQPYLIAVAVPTHAVDIYRSQRRGRAARRAGLDGFVEQAAQVGDEERRRKIAELRRELGDWQPGLRWVEDVDARAAGR